MLFYLSPTGAAPPAAGKPLGVPGGGLFREKLSWCARATFGGARWRPKTPQVAPEAPQGRQNGAHTLKWVPSGSLLRDFLSLFR